jgi:hypothetical protein
MQCKFAHRSALASITPQEASEIPGREAADILAEPCKRKVNFDGSVCRYMSIGRVPPPFITLRSHLGHPIHIGNDL